MKHFKTFALLALVLSMVQQPLQAQQKELKYGTHRIGKRNDEAMQRWRDYGLGQFIHWGVYAIPGGHWDGEIYNGAAEWIRSWSKMPKKDYDALYKQFNPTDFDAVKWARMAKQMGARYVIFTTKHHDGFCLWPSKYTDYTIAHTPFKRDIVKEVVDAYTAEGIDVYLYFSIIDWNHKGYRSAIPTTKAEKAAYETFKTFTRNQIFELLERYPQTKGLWFDGSWDKAWINEYAWTDTLETDLRSRYPKLIIGSRFRADENGKRNFDSNGNLMGDYEQGWERDLPKTIADVHGGNDWDCVMTVPENQWGYHSNWTGYVKNSYDLIDMLAQSVSLGGNFVLNFGPNGKGDFRSEEVELAKEIGQWMDTNNEAIYGCGYAGLEKQGWGYYTRKGNKLYLIVFNQPIDNRLKIVIPKKTFNPKKAYLLENNIETKLISGGRNKQNDWIFYLQLPDYYRATAPFVVVLDIESNDGDKDTYQQAHT